MTMQCLRISSFKEEFNVFIIFRPEFRKTTLKYHSQTKNINTFLKVSLNRTSLIFNGRGPCWDGVAEGGTTLNVRWGGARPLVEHALMPSSCDIMNSKSRRSFVAILAKV